MASCIPSMVKLMFHGLKAIRVPQCPADLNGLYNYYMSRICRKWMSWEVSHHTYRHASAVNFLLLAEGSWAECRCDLQSLDHFFPWHGRERAGRSSVAGWKMEMYVVLLGIEGFHPEGLAYWRVDPAAYSAPDLPWRNMGPKRLQSFASFM